MVVVKSTLQLDDAIKLLKDSQEMMCGNKYTEDN